MENEDEILNIEKENEIIDMEKAPKKKSLFENYELNFYIIGIFIVLFIFFLISLSKSLSYNTNKNALKRKNTALNTIDNSNPESNTNDEEKPKYKKYRKRIIRRYFIKRRHKPPKKNKKAIKEDDDNDNDNDTYNSNISNISNTSNMTNETYSNETNNINISNISNINNMTNETYSNETNNINISNISKITNTTNEAYSNETNNINISNITNITNETHVNETNDINISNITNITNETHVNETNDINMTNETNAKKPKHRGKEKVDELFSNFIKETELKNEKFEKNILTIKTVEEKIKKIKDKEKIDLSKSEIESETYKKNFNGEDIIKYTKECQKNPLTEENSQNFDFSENPKISVIVPFYNSENCLNILHKSIQDQSMQDIEIIYIDDSSKDKSFELIKNLQKKDKRIILLKNKKRKGSFYSRNKGAIFARGEYLQYADPSDLLVANILEKAYINAKTNNIDIIQYKAIKESNGNIQILDEMEKSSIIKQPELSKEKLYDFSDLKTANNYLFNKLIKKEKYLESLKYLNNKVLKEKLYLEEDYIQFISLLKVSNSFLFISQIGYSIIRNRDFEPLINKFDKNKMANRILHDKFIELKFIYKKVKDHDFDKELFYSYFSRIKSLYTPLAKQVTEGYGLYDEVFDLMSKDQLFDEKTEEEFTAFKNDIMVNRTKKKKKKRLFRRYFIRKIIIKK